MQGVTRHQHAAEMNAAEIPHPIVVVAGDNEVRHLQRGHDLAEASVLRRAAEICDVAGDHGVVGR